MAVQPCRPPLTSIPGTGFNTVIVPGQDGASYPNETDKLLYEIWQTLLLILAGQNPPGMSIPILFTIGDGQPTTPVAGTTTFTIAALANKSFIVIRNGIQLLFSNGITTQQILRKNTGAVAGFQFDPSYLGGPGFTFQPGESYQIFATGADTVIE